MGNPRGSKLRALARVFTGIEVSIFFMLSILLLTEGAIIKSYEKFNKTAGKIENKRCDPVLKIFRKFGGGIDQWQKNGIHTVCEPKELENVCYTPECIHAASTILKNMDTDVDPCDNFYRFACGGFLKRTIIPDDKTSVNSFSVLEDKLDVQINASIMAESESGDRKPFRLVRNLYKSCMNQTAIEAKGLEPLYDVLRKLGGWPVLDGDSWNDSDFDWRSSMYKFNDAGFSIHHFFSFGIGADLKNSTKRIIYIDQGGLDISREFLMKGFDDKIVSAYYSYMVDIAVILGAQRNRAMEELKESLSFAMKLANISAPREQRRNLTQLYNPMTVAELTKNYPNIPWKDYFSRLLPSSITVEEDEVVIVQAPSYFSNLEKIMCQTPKRVQANYAMWGVVRNSIFLLTEDIRKRQLDFSTAVSGRKKREPRWKQCIQLVSGTFPIIVGSMYVRQHFNEDAKENAVAMVADVREQFIKILKTVDWMDEETRKKALEKAASMSSYIAYPDELLDDDNLEELWQNFDLSEDNYFENIVNLSIFGTAYARSKFREPINPTDWKNHADPAVVNAFYFPTENSIDFPAGILQGAFFNNDRPKYMNYGGMGMIVGHEMTHGFDDVGRQFDKNGNFIDWWELSTKENFLKRVSCMVDQYANNTVQEVDLKLNGNNTQSENIADNGGIKAAYMAYIDWAEKNGPEPMLPGIDRTPQQMFWISAANTWCSLSRPEVLKLQVVLGAHSPTEFRVVGPYSNMIEFAKDFKCPVGSKMNPKKKCSVW